MHTRTRTHAHAHTQTRKQIIVSFIFFPFLNLRLRIFFQMSPIHDRVLVKPLEEDEVRLYAAPLLLLCPFNWRPLASY